jgi:tRNA/tmRNA/rRNA uracil-C5-methylase (TrmA/RlmC/RlmD family)
LTDRVTDPREPGVDDLLELTIGAVAHGGHFVARAPDGRVVFVRHALPGERVRAEVTEERPGYLRADAVEILEAAAERVPPPCRWSGPDRCGGCDFQHVDPAVQRDLKTAVVVEQLTRLGRMTPAEIDHLAVRVEPLSASPLGWRSRVRFTVDAAGRAGLLKHRSHEVVPVDECLIAVPQVNDARVPAATWPDDSIEVVASSGGDIAVTARSGSSSRRVSGPDRVRETFADRTWSLDPSAFWQIHPEAPATFVGAAIDLLDPRPGETAWDLYGGAGVFAAALAARVGEAGHVTVVESDQRALTAAAAALAGLPQVAFVRSTVERAGLPGRPDIVVLDPPRTGAGARVVRMLLDAEPRAIAYVACDPAALARDVATFRAGGWTLRALRAFDAFPMTHHIECIALLEPGR